jgi:hypothetical protein
LILHRRNGQLKKLKQVLNAARAEEIPALPKLLVVCQTTQRPTSKTPMQQRADRRSERLEHVNKRCRAQPELEGYPMRHRIETMITERRPGPTNCLGRTRFVNTGQGGFRCSRRRLRRFRRCQIHFRSLQSRFGRLCCVRRFCRSPHRRVRHHRGPHGGFHRCQGTRQALFVESNYCCSRGS